MSTQDAAVELFYDGQWNDHTDDLRGSDEVEIQRGQSDEMEQAQPARVKWTFHGLELSPTNPMSAVYGRIGRNTPARVVLNEAERFSGEVSSWTPRRDSGDKRVEVVAAGTTHRLDQGADPLRSPLYRFLFQELPNISGERPPVEYWPMDGPRSAMGGSDLRVDAERGTIGAIRPRLGRAEMFPWLPSGASLPNAGSQQAEGIMSARLRPLGAPLVTWAITVLYRAVLDQQDPDDSTYRLVFRLPVPVPDAGSEQGEGYWVLSLESRDDEIRVQGPAVGGGLPPLSDFHSAPQLYDGEPHVVTLNVSGGVGTDAIYRVTLDHELVGNGSFDSGLESPGRPTRLHVRWIAEPEIDPPAVTPVEFGHILYHSMSSVEVVPDELLNAFRGHAGEAAGRRMERLCAEEGVAFASTGDLDDTPPMGPQHPLSLLDLVRECAEVDQGILSDGDGPGIRYRTRRTLYNQSPALELDYAADEVDLPVDPVTDDQATRNDVTVMRPDGGEAEAVRESGPMSVQAPPDGVGRTSASIQVNTMSDGYDLQSQADWRLHLGTVDELRWPKVTVDADVLAGGLLLTGVEGDYASTPDDPSLRVTGDLTLDALARRDDWTDGSATLLGKRSSTFQGGYSLGVRSNGAPAVRWVEENEDSSLTSRTVSPEDESGFEIELSADAGEIAISASLEVDNGNGEHTVTFETADSIDGPWQQLGVLVTFSGTTNVVGGSPPLEVGARTDGTIGEFAGMVRAARVWNGRRGAGGVLVADPRFVGQPVDATEFTDSLGLLWTVHGEATLPPSALDTIRVGDLITVDNMDPGITPDQVRLLVLGWQEQIGTHRRQIAFNCAPYEPYQVAEVGHADYGVVGSDGTTVDLPFTAGSNSVMQVAIAEGYPNWIGESVPFDILVSGVRLRVTAVEAGTTTQDFTVEVAPVNGVTKDIPVGAKVDVFHKAHIGL